MKKFNKIVSVEVSVDQVSNQLLSKFDSSFPHAELATETIIGTAMNKGTLGPIIGALNGLRIEIGFEVGQQIHCTYNIYRYPKLGNSDDCSEKLEPIGECKIVDIDIYKSDKILVRYLTRNCFGEEKEEEKWVSHYNCFALVESEQDVLRA